MGLVRKAPAAVVVVLVLLSAEIAFAANLYVDGSCTTEGNGLADGCASASGGAGAWRNPQSCFTNARAGDTCLIKNGTYVTQNQGTGDPSEAGGFTVGASGTAAQPIVIRNYPGHSPLLANCAMGETSYAACARPTISAPFRQHVTIEGLRIRGGIWIYGASPVVGEGSRGIVLRGNEITQGWGEIDDGNWAAIFLANQQGAFVQGNYIHDVSVLAGGGQQSSGSCVKLYQNADSVIERNTCRSVPIAESQAGGIDDKAQAVRNVHRFNWIEDVNTCVRVNNQLESRGVQVYGNVCVNAVGTARPGVRLIVNIDDIDIHNNTFYGFAQGLQIMSEGAAVTNARFYDNIVAGASTTHNIEAYQNGLSLSNYNTWRSDARFVAPGVDVSSLSAWVSATGFDGQSGDTDCQFVSPGTDFHLTVTSPCRGAGRVGGVASGAVVDRGAYGVTSCVGHSCGEPTAVDAGAPPTDASVGTSDAGVGSESPDDDTSAIDAGSGSAGGLTIACALGGLGRGCGRGVAYAMLALVGLTAVRRKRGRRA